MLEGKATAPQGCPNATFLTPIMMILQVSFKFMYQATPTQKETNLFTLEQDPETNSTFFRKSAILKLCKEGSKIFLFKFLLGFLHFKLPRQSWKFSSPMFSPPLFSNYIAFNYFHSPIPPLLSLLIHTCTQPPPQKNN